MPRRMHPRPRFDIIQAIIAKNAFAQIFESDVVVALMVFNFSLEHHGANSEDITRPVVEESPFRWDALQAVIEAFALKVGVVESLEGRLSYPFGVVVHGGCDEV